MVGLSPISSPTAPARRPEISDQWRRSIVVHSMQGKNLGAGRSMEVTSLPGSHKAQPEEIGVALAFRVARTYAIGAVDTCVNVVDNVKEKLFGRPQHTFAKPLTGQVAIITGGNSGIGYATARELVQRGAHVIIACRDAGRGNKAVQELALTPPLPGCAPGTVEYAALDLARMDSVRAFCGAWSQRHMPLHLLVANAGVMSPRDRTTTADGLEVQFQVNFLGHWLLTHRLLAEQRQRRAAHTLQLQQASSSQHVPRPINAAAAAPPAPSTRVVIITSLTHHAGRAQWHDLQSTDGYSPFLSYAGSKLANTVFAIELQRRIDRNAGRAWSSTSPTSAASARMPHAAAGQDASEAAGVMRGVVEEDCVVAVHPGVVDTHLARTYFKEAMAHEMGGALLEPILKPLMSWLVDTVKPLAFKTPEQSGRIVAWACLAPCEHVAGKYVVDCRIDGPDVVALEPVRGANLWAMASALTGEDTHGSLV